MVRHPGGQRGGSIGPVRCSGVFKAVLIVSDEVVGDVKGFGSYHQR